MKIPKGWHKLDNGTILAQGDMCFFPSAQSFQPSNNIHNNWRVGSNSFTYIRKNVKKNP